MLSTFFNFFFFLPLVFLLGAFLMAASLGRNGVDATESPGLALSRFVEEYLWLLLYQFIYITVAPVEAVFRAFYKGSNVVSPTGKKPVIVIIHAYLSTQSHWLLLEFFARRNGFGDVIRFGYSPFSGSLDEWSASLANKLEPFQKRGVIIIGHSLGGILGIWTASLLPEGVVKKVITLGSPLKGTVMSRFAISPIARNLKPEGDVIEKTGRIINELQAELYCFWSKSDLLIVPHDSAAGENGNAIELSGMGHTGYHFWCLKGANELFEEMGKF